MMQVQQEALDRLLPILRIHIDAVGGVCSISHLAAIPEVKQALSSMPVPEDRKITKVLATLETSWCFEIYDPYV